MNNWFISTRLSDRYFVQLCIFQCYQFEYRFQIWDKSENRVGFICVSRRTSGEDDSRFFASKTSRLHEMQSLSRVETSFCRDIEWFWFPLSWRMFSRVQGSRVSFSLCHFLRGEIFFLVPWFFFLKVKIRLRFARFIVVSFSLSSFSFSLFLFPFYSFYVK